MSNLSHTYIQDSCPQDVVDFIQQLEERVMSDDEYRRLNADLSKLIDENHGNGKRCDSRWRKQRRVATSYQQMVVVVASLAGRCWFEVMPLPDNQYEISVKVEHKHTLTAACRQLGDLPAFPN